MSLLNIDKKTVGNIIFAGGLILATEQTGELLIDVSEAIKEQASLRQEFDQQLYDDVPIITNGNVREAEENLNLQFADFVDQNAQIQPQHIVFDGIGGIGGIGVAAIGTMIGQRNDRKKQSKV